MTEIRWAIHLVIRGYSNSSNASVGALFKGMFPDSDITTKMEIGVDKL